MSLPAITGQQIEAARKLLHWSQPFLAEAAGLRVEAIARVELGRSDASAEDFRAVKAALEQDGITFIGSHGVELRRRPGGIKTPVGPLA
jgi:transcriptional regulator with XRE-family HTH domain